METKTNQNNLTAKIQKAFQGRDDQEEFAMKCLVSNNCQEI